MDLSDYDQKRKVAKDLYDTFQNVSCPALSSPITFSSHGFNHIMYPYRRHERDKVSQIMRFKLLDKAYKLICITTTFQEYEIKTTKIQMIRQKKNVFINQKVHYWGLIAIIDNYKIKVILRKIDNGSIHFWSIIPAWTTNKIRDSKYMKGNPEYD